MHMTKLIKAHLFSIQDCEQHSADCGTELW